MDNYVKDVGVINMKGRFLKGHKPWNKGKKGIHLSRKSEFKKGLHAPNFKGYGNISISRRTERRVELYTTIPTKIRRYNTRDKKWNFTRKRIPYSRYLWIIHNGNIPKGMIVYNTSQNPLDVRIENLILLTRAELLKTNNMLKTSKQRLNVSNI